MLKCRNCDEIYDLIFYAQCAAGQCSKCACENMEELKPKIADFKTEKHIPIISKTDKGIKVTIGSTLHPMIESHWITMIQVEWENNLYRKYLKPGDKPEAEFPIDTLNVKAFEYCNVHGYWSN